MRTVSVLLCLLGCGTTQGELARAQEIDTDVVLPVVEGPPPAPLEGPEPAEESTQEPHEAVAEEATAEEAVPEAEESSGIDPFAEEGYGTESPLSEDTDLPNEPAREEAGASGPVGLPILEPQIEQAHPIQQVKETLNRGEALDWYLADKLNQKAGKTPPGWEMPQIELYKTDPRSHAPNASELYPELESED